MAFHVINVADLHRTCRISCLMINRMQHIHELSHCFTQSVLVVSLAVGVHPLRGTAISHASIDDSQVL